MTWYTPSYPGTDTPIEVGDWNVASVGEDAATFTIEVHLG